MKNFALFLNAVSEDFILRCQEHVEFMKNLPGRCVHVRMVAYDDLLRKEDKEAARQ